MEGNTAEIIRDGLGGRATNVDVAEVGGDTVVDFDVSANGNYEIQSCVITDDDGRVVEAGVRFGRVEERPALGVGEPVLHNAWLGMVDEVFGDVGALEADLSDFGHTVPHLRIDREDVEDYGVETVDVAEFAAGIAELVELVETVLRADDQTMDAEIDAYL